MQVNEVTRLINSLLKKANVRKPPVLINRIAKILNADVKIEVLDGDISGFLYRDGHHAIVGVNQSHPERRQRFTIAHELAHVVLKHHGKFFVDRGSMIFRNSFSSTGEDQVEREANNFAARLLMPEEMLKKDLGRVSVDLDDPKAIEKLSRKYKVSVQAMTYRLTNLGFMKPPQT